MRLVDTNVLLYAVSAPSEDVNAGQEYAGLRVVNPFAGGR